MASDGEALTGLWLEDQKYFAATLADAYEEKQLPVFEQTVRWLDLYFHGKVPDFTPPLRMEGTPFQKAVWDRLLTIPYGKTVTYGQIAQNLAKTESVCARNLAKTDSACTRDLARTDGTQDPAKTESVCARNLARAVGGAVGRNPISLIVPCHRVIGAGGKLTGYAGGIEKKEKLLSMERKMMIP